MIANASKSLPLRWAWGNHVELDAEVGKHRDIDLDVFNDEPIEKRLEEVSVAGSNAFTVLDGARETIAPTRSASIKVRYAPTIEATERSTLTVTPNAGDGTTLSLVGHGHAQRRKPDPHPKSPVANPTLVHEDANHKWRIDAPSTIDLGETIVGQVWRASQPIFAAGRHQGPRIQARVVGDPSIKLTRAPLFLPGYGEGEQTQTFAFEYRPTRRGDTSTTLEIEVMDMPYETHRIPVHAAAHLAGEPEIAEEKASKIAAKRQAEREHEDAASHERALREGEKADRVTTLEQSKYLDREKDQAEAAVHTLTDLRGVGITNAYKEADLYNKKAPAVEVSLLEKLAWMAFDVATAVFANSAKLAIERPLTNALTTRTSRIPTLQDPDLESVVPPSRVLVGMVSELVKQIIKGGGSAAKDHIRAPKPPVPNGGSAPVGGAFDPTSNDSQIEFFAQLEQHQIVAGAGHARALFDTRAALLPLLKTAPDAAVTAMREIRLGLEACWASASALQAQESILHWVRYVEETNEPEDPLHANPDQPVNGLIDVTAALVDPSTPVHIEKFRLHGVSDAIVQRLKRRQLGDLGLAIRVVGHFGSAGESITIFRDSNGRIEFTDTTQEGHRHGWLARKASRYGASFDEPRGARILMEEEILPHYLDDAGVDNDSTDTKKTK